MEDSGLKILDIMGLGVDEVKEMEGEYFRLHGLMKEMYVDAARKYSPALNKLEEDEDKCVMMIPRD
jgi:hypothetical protein